MKHELVKMFKEKLNNFTISDYHGLKSPGLTCYLNSVLQVLFMTENFREPIKRSRPKNPTAMDALLKDLFENLQIRLAATHGITEQLGITDVYEQRDAAEYFEKILCLSSPEASKIFKGELEHKATCLQCKKRNDSRSFFWILPLAMETSRRHAYSVERGLQAFFKREEVRGENKMYCNQCGKKQNADIECEMTRNPEILTLLLKRFTFDYALQCYDKLRCKVDVPRALHVKNCRYDLYAIVNHSGNLTGGHYTAEIKSYETGEWYCFNDDVVSKLERPEFGSGSSSVRSSKAYLLMYRKESERSEIKVDLEAQCAQSDVEAEGGYAEAERGEAAVPHLKDERCNGGDNLNGDALTKTYDDWRERTDPPVELEKTPKRRDAFVKPDKDIFLQTDAEAGGDLWKTSLRTQKLNFSEARNGGGPHEPDRRRLRTNPDHARNHNATEKRLKPSDVSRDGTGRDITAATAGTKTKRVAATRNGVEPDEGKGVKNKRGVAREGSEADVCSSVLNARMRTHSKGKTNEPRHGQSGSVKRNNEKPQQVVTNCDEGRKKCKSGKTKNAKHEQPWR